MPWYFLLSFESIDLSAKKKKRKTNFQDGRHGGHLRFSIRIILTIFDLQIVPIFPTKFQVKWPFRSREVQNRFSTWPPRRPSYVSNQTILAIFDLQGIPILPIMKTRLFKYTENYTNKKGKFSDKKFWYFSYFCPKHRLWVLVRTSSARRF